MHNFLGLGVAGNFANHLEQAGEDTDFKEVLSDEEGAPKGLFPFYIPNDSGFLGRFCIDSNTVIMPKNPNLKVQAEPEIALECIASYDDNGFVKDLEAKFFMAFNDASVRNDSSAKKLSQKKNFSKASKGFGNKIAIDKFDNGGICDNYSLTSFVIFDEKVHQYGDMAELTSYSYFYNKLMNWIVKKLNTQTDHAVLQDLHQILKNANYPSNLIICIGATSYTDLAKKRFLQEGDEICVATYNHHKYSNEQIKEIIQNGINKIDDCSIVRQKVIRDNN